MRKTEHLKLQMPEDSDFILIEDLNANSEILDETLKKIANTLALLNTQGVDISELLKKKADLDQSGKVKEDQLPEMKLTNFVQVYEARGNFPDVGERNVLYLSKATNKVYFYDTDDRQYEVISASLDLGETHRDAYRGDRGKTAYDHSKSPHLELGETSSTAYRGDRGKLAYDHSRSAHLGLGETSTTAYRGDRGKIAYDHSQSPHAPVDALKRSESYSRAELDSKMDEVKTFSKTIPASEYTRKGYLDAFKRNGVVTLRLSGFIGPGSSITIPAGFRPALDISVPASESIQDSGISGASSGGYVLYIDVDGSLSMNTSYTSTEYRISFLTTYVAK